MKINEQKTQLYAPHHFPFGQIWNMCRNVINCLFCVFPFILIKISSCTSSLLKHSCMSITHSISERIWCGAFCLIIMIPAKNIIIFENKYVRSRFAFGSFVLFLFLGVFVSKSERWMICTFSFVCHVLI